MIEKQLAFSEVDDNVIPPEGYVGMFELFNALGTEQFGEQWHGLDEARLKGQEPDYSSRPPTEIFEGGIGDIRQEANAAIERARIVLSEIRNILVAGAIHAIGVDNDGQTTQVKSELWRGRLATKAIYQGRFILADGRIVSNFRENNAISYVLMFNQKGINEMISKRYRLNDSEYTTFYKEAEEWLILKIHESPHKNPSSKFKLRDAYKEETKQYFPDTKWQSVWDAALHKTGNTAWSKAGRKKS